MMQWTVRLETRTSAGEVTTTELATFSRPAMIVMLAEVGLVLSETKMLLAKLQASRLCGQVAEYAAHHRACVDCGALQPLKDRRTRRLQTLFGTVEVEAPRFKLCRCRLTTPLAEVTVSPVCAADGPLHARAGAGAGRVGRAHLVSGWCAHSGSFAARLAGKP